MKVWLVAVLGLSLIGVSALAQERETNSLTPAKIREFIGHVTEKTKPGGRLPDAEVATYLNAHLADDGIYFSSIVFQLPGYPEQVRDLTLTKEDFINNVLQGRQSIQNYQSTVSVGSIAIDKSKTSATIQTVTKEKGRMPLEGSQPLPFDGEAVCSQQLKLVNKLIVISSASCQTRLTIQER